LKNIIKKQKERRFFFLRQEKLVSFISVVSGEEVVEKWKMVGKGSG
jgi:hypothetical protein